MKDNKRTQRLSREVFRLKVALRIANQFKALYLSKWEKWETRARAIQSEHLHR